MSKRKIASRARGASHGPITRVFSPSDAVAQLIKPFVFLDYFLQDGPMKGFDLHPHSGIATLTYLIEGDVGYIDTSGNTGRLRAGGLEWMRAGGGAWHGGGGGGGGRTRGFQLWVALPPALENGESASFFAAPEEVRKEGPVTVLLGEHGGAKSPFQTPAPMNYFHVRLNDGERWPYQPPQGHTVAWAYPYQGSLDAGGRIATGELAVFENSEEAVEFTAVGDAAFMFGAAVRHPHDLVLGYYSVHTSEESLEMGEARIKELGEKLRREGRLNR